MRMKTIVVIPTYNEADTIRELVGALWALRLPDFSILVVDDASPDGTADIVEQLCHEQPGRISVMRRGGKKGLGAAYKEGFSKALAMSADVIVQMDADMSHSPRYIPRMLDLLADYDLVIGSRYVKGGNLDQRWSFGRYLLSRWANAIYIRLILRTRTLDATAGFKAWRRQTLLGLDLSRIHSTGYDFQFEMAYVSERLGYRMIEIPIHFEDRRVGHSKMSTLIKFGSAVRVWDVLVRHRCLTPKHRAGQSR